jgi:hypothetical protein
VDLKLNVCGNNELLKSSSLKIVVPILNLMKNVECRDTLFSGMKKKLRIFPHKKVKAKASLETPQFILLIEKVVRLTKTQL